MTWRWSLRGNRFDGSSSTAAREVNSRYAPPLNKGHTISCGCARDSSARFQCLLNGARQHAIGQPFYKNLRANDLCSLVIAGTGDDSTDQVPKFTKPERC